MIETPATLSMRPLHRAVQSVRVPSPAGCAEDIERMLDVAARAVGIEHPAVEKSTSSPVSASSG